MAIRSNSPISESLLWKARLTQHNAQLKSEKDALKATVKELSERVGAAEAKVQSITDLADRVTAIEQDNEKRQEYFEKLDGDRRRRLQRLEDTHVALYQKVRGTDGKLDELIEERGHVGERREHDALVAAQFERLEIDFSELLRQYGNLRKERDSVIESTTIETGAIRLNIRSLEAKVEALATRLMAATTALRRKEQDVQECVKSSTSTTGPSQGATRPSQKAAKFSKCTTKKPATSALAKRDVLTDTKAKSCKPPIAKIPAITPPTRPDQAQTKDSRQQQNQPATVAPLIWRSRTTRQGTSGWQSTQQLTNCAAFHSSKDTPRLDQTLEVNEDMDAHRSVRSSTRSSNKRSRIEDDRDEEECRRVISSNQQLKRAKQTTIVTRLFLNLKSSAAAGDTRTTEARALAPPLCEPPAGATTIQTAPVTILAAPTSKLAHNLLATRTTPPDQQASSCQSSAARSRPTHRRQIRMPNLPPTPPPPSP